ncbi:hypothetical protein YYC_02730 [Plasmodium yoelii 17X]|uniref:Mediator of RNA polymerase II transcription subunit 10 n=4 Tax=Plasmodium yoelii TaxID=5861 RepID=A0AAF0B3Z6_PLAYO|nr:mediator of RNA polymerase II transcription subunit 10, putative [Plasmodium yoelii]EAA20731.1 hypothetical protein [Plasmodium yoelii yoelii]ETB60447.1 hypothetical protein YYC_02730 [Plasmodium yoelii 17X]WBY56579.1 mediator of RNA polymerase II transcription subunit 10 [Plasmodium yoelii yoelii]CDU17439.1 conserved Plasmodium protein, unknown function [Plasmodium yoelii]VTZ77154.1 mediator of RNA polymerase II transcription subunit 10, putative [Plasmodium yoelii]|eukprot:XP_729166.1 mediator of RNA polymerase II transcription subunit 10, putative [Plasmodium yoelii]
MKGNKGRIKLKINLGNENSNTESSLVKNKSSVYSDSNQSKENFKGDDNNSNASDKKLKDKNLEKKIVSIISKLTKIACICENKKNTNLNNIENNNEQIKVCKKLIKQMYKYEKCLININNYINDKNNNLDEVTFPSGLIKAVDNYMSPDVWIYKYLLVECKKYNDKYRNIIQNISTFNATLKHKILNEDSNQIVMPIYSPVSEDKLSFLDDSHKNYYKNVHIPKELAQNYIESMTKEKDPHEGEISNEQEEYRVTNE